MGNASICLVDVQSTSTYSMETSERGRGEREGGGERGGERESGITRRGGEMERERITTLGEGERDRITRREGERGGWEEVSHANE